MPNNIKQQRISLQHLVKFLLKENISNSVEILQLQMLIQKNLKLKKKDKKNLKKQTDKLIKKVTTNVSLLKKMHDTDEKK